MPISDEALQNAKNRFIAVTGDAKLGQAVAALTSLGGQPWWHLVVRMDDGSWRVARFGELNESVADTEDAAEMFLRDAKQLRVASAVEQGSVETRAAQALARKSPTHVLVVTDNGMPVGILVEGITRGAAPPGGPVMPSASLNELGGKYIKLKDYGSILLGSSKK
ncbi:MAG TPA: hypothetical protein VN696_13430 [Pyrinomonadaceae bacterium]|nr:hypothetical protein [Pyrinomonadaceae bacterium]